MKDGRMDGWREEIENTNLRDSGWKWWERKRAREGQQQQPFTRLFFPPPPVPHCFWLVFLVCFFNNKELFFTTIQVACDFIFMWTDWIRVVMLIFQRNGRERERK